MYTHTYLKKRGIKIFKDGIQILNGKTSKKDSFKKQDTKIEKGTNLINKKEIYQIPYQFLKSHHIVITEHPFRGFGKTVYSLAYSNTNAKSLDLVPEKHKIEYDNFYRVARIVGPYVDPDDDNWFPIDRKNENRYDINDLKEDLFNEKETEFIEVKEQILGKSKEGELVCLPFVNDAHRISITGMSGHGKTLLDHRIKDGIIEKDYGRVIELNDRKEESTVYHQTWKTHEFCSDELQLINEFSKPMPMQYLYPMNNVLEEKGEDTVISENGNIGFSFTIPFEEVLKDRKSVKYYEDWAFGKSIKSLRSLLKDKEFMAFKSYEEQESYINAKKSIPHNSKSKICDILSDMWTTNIFDISTGINPYWEYEIDGKRNKEYPWVIGLISNLSTSISTQHIISEPYYPIVFRFVLKTTFNAIKTHPLLENTHFYFSTDEVHDLLKDKNAQDLIDEAIKTGRSDGIGNLVVTQYSHELLPSIKTNISLNFVFHQEIEDNDIKNKLKKYPYIYNRLPHLRNMECVAIGEFKLIDTISGKSYMSNGRPIIMKIFPPNSKHKAPPINIKNGKEN